MGSITAEEIVQLEGEHEAYHAGHANQYGSIATCNQVKCVEMKLAIAWLKEHLPADARLAA